MIKTVRKVGDSLGVTLPTRELRKLGVYENTPINVVIENGAIKLYPLQRHPQTAKIRRQTRRLISQYAEAIDLLAER